MGDSITGRTMFYDDRNGEIRFHDWCLVDTTLGTMQQPRHYHLRGSNKASGSAVSLNDQCAKITRMVYADLRGIEVLLSDGKKVCIGGNQFPTNYAW